MFRNSLMPVLALALFAGCSGSAAELSSGAASMDAMPSAVAADPAMESGANESIQSGTLTAGSFDDNAEIDVYRNFVKSMGQHQAFGPLGPRLSGQTVVLTITDAAGGPVGNARVVVGDREYVTRTDGRAVLLLSFDGLPEGESLEAEVRAPGVQNAVSATIPADAEELSISVPAARVALPSTLDLALVVDVTGSMGDELEYLKKEISSIANTVHRRFPDVEQRFALVVYRDDGDDFVTEVYDFMPRIEDFQARLASHTADGGGDYPEAMHVAMEKAGRLEWRGGNTASVLFLVADAPPHDEFVDETLTAVDVLRKRGVVIYPVAASGVADECELVMRTAALLTGAKYLFLTDDSGVGLSHAEPHIPYYDVERLDRLMVRMIASELAGERIEPEPDEIIRSVDHRKEPSGQ